MGFIFTIFFLYISNEIFYSNSLPYKRYIFDKYFVKILLQNFKIQYLEFLFEIGEF